MLRPSLYSLLFPLLVVLSNCKDDSIVLVCPAGTEMSDGICCPPGTIGQGGYCVENPDSGIKFSPRDTKDVNEQDTAPNVTDNGFSHQDTAKDTFETTGAVGAPCMQDDQCAAGGSCLSWPGGYCTFLGCGGDDVPCPAGSECASTGNATTCMQSCEEHGDCRSDEGYACKTVPAANGMPVSICHGLDENAGEIGAPCATHTECKDAATCYTGVEGGICLLDNCTVGSCPDETSCVMVDGVPRCLKRCNYDGECNESGVVRTCEVLSTPPGEAVNVCFVPQGAEPIGADCAGGYACASSLCRIVAKGVCSFDDAQGCLTNLDCAEGQICIVGTQHYRGVCSAECNTASCTGTAGCLIDEQNQGWCTALCEGTNDPNCNTQIGTQCLFGTAVGTSVGKYFCAKAIHPGPLTPCVTDETCGPGGQCLIAEPSTTGAASGDASGSTTETHGYCLVPCGSSGACAFPGQCLPWGTNGEYFCMRPCNTAEECPEHMTCPVVQGNNRACTPPP